MGTGAMCDGSSGKLFMKYMKNLPLGVARVSGNAGSRRLLPRTGSSVPRASGPAGEVAEGEDDGSGHGLPCCRGGRANAPIEITCLPLLLRAY
jgi:hypothetical protein